MRSETFTDVHTILRVARNTQINISFIFSRNFFPARLPKIAFNSLMRPGPRPTIYMLKYVDFSSTLINRYAYCFIRLRAAQHSSNKIDLRSLCAHGKRQNDSIWTGLSLRNHTPE